MKNPKNSKHRQQSVYSNPDLFEIDEIIKAPISATPEYIKKLEENNVALQQMINELNHQLKQKTEEIQHLMNMLNASVPTIGEATPIIPTDEEVIAEFQLKALKAAAMVRDLTLDEVKRYDLLVKNKRLAQGAATTIDGQAKKPLVADRTTLIQIASSKLKGE